MSRQPRLLTVGQERDDRPTPAAFFNELDREFGFTLDVAASPENAKCARFLTPDDDGVQSPWDGVVWCNPPYSEIPLWVEKARQEQTRGILSVLLLPVATDTRWFHDWVLPYAEVRFVKGRLKFEGQKDTAPFASMLAIYRPEETA